MSNPQSYEPRPKKAEITPRETIYVYHWDRILGVVAILVLLTAAGGYGLYTWLSPEVPPRQAAEPARTFEQAQTEPTPPPSRFDPPNRLEEASSDSSIALQQTAVQAPIAQSAPSQEPPARPEVEADRHESEPEKPTSAPTPPATATIPATAETPSTTPVSEAESLTTDQQQPAPTLESEPESAPQFAADTSTAVEQPEQSVVQESPVTQQSNTGRPFQLQEQRILNPQVTRFELPRSVIDKEPQGELNQIDWKPDGSAAVLCYSEVTGRRGSMLRYVWYYAGKRIARVLVKVRGNRWRSYSSKVINQRHLGNWRVELQDSKERVLASAEFTVR